jgi:pimeloyl-ACP methyl ester carboxylesterase
VDADGLVALLETFSEPVHLGGWSCSGAVVLQAALDRPDLVERGVIFEPAFAEIIAGDPQYEGVLAQRDVGWRPMAAPAQQGKFEEAKAS